MSDPVTVRWEPQTQRYLPDCKEARRPLIQEADIRRFGK